MSAKVLKGMAVVVVLLVLGCVVAAILATTRRVQIQGPTAIAVLADGSVWLSVEDALWHLDAGGSRVAIADAATLNVGGRIGNLLVHPDGHLVAQVRGDPTLYFLDPQTAVIASRLVPQWQPGLGEHGSDAINYAFSDDGRVAIATGGGHAVALFDATGRFLARTKPGTYEFTNGLWWSGSSLWTTDTNREQLVELDGETLSEKSRVPLCGTCGKWQFLGMATPSHGKAHATSQKPPLATLIRFANGMTEGRAADVFSDGSQLDFPAAGALEPRDLKWRGDELLLVDNARFSIRRYSGDRVALPDFGDAAVQGELAASLAQRDRLDTQYTLSLYAAVALLMLAVAMAVRAQTLETARALAAYGVDVSRLATPVPTPSAQAKVSLKLFFPALLVLVPAQLLFAWLAIRPSLATLLQDLPFAIFPIAGLAVFALAWAVQRRTLLRARDDPDAVALFNLPAVRFLKKDAAFWRVRRPDELPLETWLLRTKGMGVTFNWLVLTNQRLLVFTATMRDRVLAKACPLGDVRLHVLEVAEMTPQQRLQHYFFPLGAVFRIEFRDGTSLTGFTPAGATVRRAAVLLQAEAGAAPPHADLRGQAAHAAPPAEGVRSETAIRQAVASALIPGVGQWMQQRSGMGWIFFLTWLLASMPLVAIGWTLWHVLAAVSWPTVLSFGGIYLLVCALAAWEAWEMRAHMEP